MRRRPLSIAAHPTPLNLAWGIAVDSASDMYVADYAEGRIVRLALGHDGDLYVIGTPMGSVEVWHITGDRKDRVYLRRSTAALMRLGAWMALALLVVLGIAAVAKWQGRGGV